MPDLLTILNALIIIGMAVTAVLACALEDELASVIALGATGIFATAEFLLLHAPDVAISEAAVGAALTPLIFIIALRRIKGRKSK